MVVNSPNSPVNPQILTSPQERDRPSWQIMLVSNDAKFIQQIQLSLQYFTFDGNPLTWIYADSQAAARESILTHPDTAVILLDLADDGLSLVQYIRSELENKLVRIIGLVDKPEYLPDLEVIVASEFNDYQIKKSLNNKEWAIAIFRTLKSYQEVKKTAKTSQKFPKLEQKLNPQNTKVEEFINNNSMAS